MIYRKRNKMPKFCHNPSFKLSSQDTFLSPRFKFTLIKMHDGYKVPKKNIGLGTYTNPNLISSSRKRFSGNKLNLGLFLLTWTDLSTLGWCREMFNFSLNTLQASDGLHLRLIFIVWYWRSQEVKGWNCENFANMLNLISKLRKICWNPVNLNINLVQNLNIRLKSGSKDCASYGQTCRINLFHFYLMYI